MSARISAACEKALQVLAQGGTVAYAAGVAGIAQSTLYRAIKRLGIDLPHRIKDNSH